MISALEHYANIQALWITTEDYNEKRKEVRRYLLTIDKTTLFKILVYATEILTKTDAGDTKYKLTDCKALRTIVKKRYYGQDFEKYKELGLATPTGEA